MAYAAVISLVSALENILFSPHISADPLSQQATEFACEELETLQEILERLDASSKGRSRKKVNALDAEIKEAVWEFEDLIESHVYDRLIRQSDSDRILDPELRHDIDGFVEMVKEKEEEYVSELDNLNSSLPDEDEAAGSTQIPADSGGRKLEFEMVGSSFDMLLEVIRARLDFSSPVDVVPVVGMAGIGKTAVAREFFDDPLLLSELEFDCRAWVSVGRKPRMISTIKRDILTQLDPATAGRKIKERNVDHYLKRIFKSNRCLVVLDDVWDTHICDELESLIPNYGRGKILVLLTTRLQHVGNEIDKSWSKIRCEVELLDQDQSWDLLLQRLLLFEEIGECPAEFIKSGKKIAEKCDGLPLMILAVAALLSEAEMTVEFWEEVAEKANHPIFTAAYDQLYEVLLPSYEYLPQHLKPCFLHMGVFPQYSEIGRTKLLCLWASEGFFDPTIEDPFYTYMRELVDHSVAMVCQIGSVYDKDNMKTCRLHSTFWHLCRSEATNTKFCRVLTNRDDAFQQLTIKGQRRLSFHNNILLAMRDVVDSLEEACTSSARSLFCYGPYHPYQVPICFGLKLLKVLDACNLRFFEFPEQVIQMVYLRYLALTCNTVLPPSISRLWDLQFLSIHRNEIIRFSGETPFVPVEIWDMKQLECIQLDGWNLPNPPPRDSNGDEDEDEDGGSSSSLEGLETLVGVGAETCTREVLERIPNLTKLGIMIESSPDADDMEQVLDHLNNIYLLPKLLMLKCIVFNPILVTRNNVISPLSMFPPSLGKLCLSGLGYPWECMSIIGSLPKLEVLKLRCYAFRGPEWVVRYGEFRALRFLLIDGTDLVHFEVEDRGLFSLRTFILQNCYKLKHLLWELDPSYPVSIGVFDCSPAAATFAHKMRSRYEPHSQGQHLVDVQSAWE